MVIIEGQPYPKRIAVQRDKLAQRIAQQGFAPVLEAAAYTWFNRFAAIRYLELHGYPPYMGSNPQVKSFASERSPRSKSDLFAVSTECFIELSKPTGFAAFMTPFTWMTLKSYEGLRSLLLGNKTLQSLIEPEYHAFFDSAFVPICTFALQNCHTSGFNASFIGQSNFYGAELQPLKTREAIGNPGCGWLYRAITDDFRRIPGSPVAYSASDRVKTVFSSFDTSSGSRSR